VPLAQRERQRRGTDPIRRPVRAEGEKQPDRISKVIGVSDADGCVNPHVVQEAVEVWGDAKDIREVGAPVPAVVVVVDSRLPAGVEVVDLEIAAGDYVVVAEQDAGDGAEENLIGCQKGDEDAGGAEEVPGVDGEGDDGADEETFSDRQVLGEQGSNVIPCREGVLEDSGEDRGVGETGGDEETASAVAGCVGS